MFHPAVGTGYVKTEFCGDERSLSEAAAKLRLGAIAQPSRLPVAHEGLESRAAAVQVGEACQETRADLMIDSYHMNVKRKLTLGASHAKCLHRWECGMCTE
jgi:hypothetical protein